MRHGEGPKKGRRGEARTGQTGQWAEADRQAQLTLAGVQRQKSQTAPAGQLAQPYQDS